MTKDFVAVTKTVREAEDAAAAAAVELPSITETSKNLKISSFEAPKLNPLPQLPIIPVLGQPLILYKLC